VQVNGFWAWAPGRIHARPVYAPALVAFVGNDGWQTTFAFGNAHAVGWFPLGWGEPYHPYYHCSNNYGRNLNTPHVNNYVHNGRRDHPFIHRGFTTIVPRDRFTSPIVAMNQALKSAITLPPVARVHPIAPPSAIIRAVMTPAPGLNQGQNNVVGRVTGQHPPVTQPAPDARAHEPQPRNDNPWHRRPAPANPQPVAQTPAAPVPAGRPVMQQPIPVVQPNVAPQPAVQAPPNQDHRGHRPPGWTNQAPPQNPVVRAVEPIARPPMPVAQAIPQPVSPPQIHQPSAPQAAPIPNVKSNNDNHRRHREAGDNDGGERRMHMR
jgi:hypothetical protein